MIKLSFLSEAKVICLSLFLIMLFALSIDNLYAADIDDRILEEGIGGTGHEDVNKIDVPEVPEIPANYIPERSTVGAINSGAFTGNVLDTSSASGEGSGVNTAIDIDTDNDTKFYYASVYLKHKSRGWAYGINIPYLQVRGGNFVNADSQLDSRNNENGLGDISLHMSYTPHVLLEGKLYIGYSLGVKLATADEDEGLGSGKTDYMFSADLFYRINNATPFFKIGYKARGDSSADQLENGAIASLGVDYEIMGKHSFGYMYDYLAARRRNEDAMESSVLYGNFKISRSVSLTTFYQLGHSDSAAEKGLGVTLVNKF